MKQGLIQALCIAALAGLPAACGAPTSPIPASGAIAQNRIALDALPYHKTFTFTGKKQTFIVPAGVTSITVVARGAAGTDAGKYGVVSGLGGRVYADIPVTPGETLYVFVGGAGTSSDGRGVGGFNGGGNSGYCCDNAEGSGGGTDIREGGDQLRHRILVAGGGGGQGGLYGGIGGNGGGLTGADGGRGTSFGSADSNGNGGSGGTQYAGGSGGKGGKANGYRSYPGKRGKPGLFGRGGRGAWGGRGESSDSYGAAGGGGGGGYYGGGGGGGGSGGGDGGDGSAGGGGAGGSSYVEPSATRVKMWQGWKNATGDGLVVLSWNKN